MLVTARITNHALHMAIAGKQTSRKQNGRIQKVPHDRPHERHPRRHVCGGAGDSRPVPALCAGESEAMNDDISDESKRQRL